MSDDNLEESSQRLGDRFSQMGNQSDDDTSEPRSPGPGDQPEYQPTTIYLPEELRTELRRFLMQLQLDYPEIDDRKKREQHTALIEAAIEQPETIVEKLEDGNNE